MSKENDPLSNARSQIFCLTWVKRKAAKPCPDYIRLSDSEIGELLLSQDKEIAGQSTSDHSIIGGDDDDDDYDNGIKNDTNSSENHNVSDEDDEFDDLKEFNFKDYDKESDAIYGEKMCDLVVYSSNKEDPYMKQKVDANEESDEEIHEKEALTVRDDDNLLVAGRCDRDLATLEVFVYNHSNKEFYCHHDLNLSSAPLCIQWLNFDAGSAQASQSNDTGNFVSLGYMEPLIEIWDLDVVNAIEPSFTLGVSKQKHDKLTNAQKNQGHQDAILDMSWSYLTRKKLASASADRCVALWDLQTCVMERRFKVHKDKVQTLEWKPTSTDCLLSGAFDGRVIALDTKATPSGRLKWNLSGEIERVAWNADDSNYFAASSDSGKIYLCDLRVPMKPVFHFKAHDDAITALSLTSGKLHSGSSDGLAKIWNVKGQKADLVSEKTMKMGMIHCFHKNPDIKNLFAVGGEKGGVRIWNTHSSEMILETDPPEDAEDIGDNTEDKKTKKKTKQEKTASKENKSKKKKVGLDDAIRGDHDSSKIKKPGTDITPSGGKSKSLLKKPNTLKKEKVKELENEPDTSGSSQPLLDSSSKDTKLKRKRRKKPTTAATTGLKKRRLYPKQRRKLLKKLAKNT